MSSVVACRKIIGRSIGSGGLNGASRAYLICPDTPMVSISGILTFHLRRPGLRESATNHSPSTHLLDLDAQNFACSKKQISFLSSCTTFLPLPTLLCPSSSPTYLFVSRLTIPNPLCLASPFSPTPSLHLFRHLDLNTTPSSVLARLILAIKVRNECSFEPYPTCLRLPLASTPAL